MFSRSREKGLRVMGQKVKRIAQKYNGNATKPVNHNIHINYISKAGQISHIY